jgi:hypothetical protein
VSPLSQQEEEPIEASPAREEGRKGEICYGKLEMVMCITSMLIYNNNKKTGITTEAYAW